MTAVRVHWTFDDGAVVEFDADLSTRVVPDDPSEDGPSGAQCVLLAYRGEERQP